MSSRDERLWQPLQVIYDELVAALEIDKYDLDTALEQQATLYLRASDLFSDCTAIRDQLKEELNRKSAVMAEEFRVAGAHKTVAAIKDAVDQDDTITVLRIRIGTWIDKCNRANALRDAMDQRGKSARELAHLYVGGYYQTSSAGSRAQLERKTYEDNRARLAEARRSKSGGS